MKDWNVLAIILLFAAAFAASWGGVALFRRWSLHRNLLDVPNDRSSHSIPTPRGGGLVVVIIALLGYATIAAVFGVPFSWGYFIGALLIAGVSWLDDLYSLPFWGRLIVHIAASLALIADIGPWNDLFVPILSLQIPLGSAVGAVVTVGWLVWLINAYNFMDGIDGIAALQAVVAGVAWAALSVVLDLNGTFLFSGVLAFASVGFLIHNWQPAKIFMGDVGSAYLGYTLAAMPLLARHEAQAEIPVLPIAAAVFLWLFVFDTVLTFIKRALRKQRVWEAHREHLYQRLIIDGSRHATVTILYGCASAILSSSIILAIAFRGISDILALSIFLTLTALMVYLSFRKKR